MAAVDFVNYLQNALRGGGYYAPQAAGLYRLRNNVPHPVFTVLAGVPNPPDCVILHFRNVMRVSKNLKELSHNARIVPPDGGGVVVYETIKISLTTSSLFWVYQNLRVQPLYQQIFAA